MYVVDTNLDSPVSISVCGQSLYATKMIIEVGADRCSVAKTNQKLLFVKPTGQPTGQPTRQPTRQPTGQPTRQPTRQPTSRPTRKPSGHPTRQPTAQPTRQPTRQPTTQPTGQPTRQPTGQPTSKPTFLPPTSQPTAHPSRKPSGQPTLLPTSHPSIHHTMSPTTRLPTYAPVSKPTNYPTIHPTSPAPTTSGQTHAPTFANQILIISSAFTLSAVSSSTLTNSQSQAIVLGSANAFNVDVSTVYLQSVSVVESSNAALRNVNPDGSSVSLRVVVNILLALPPSGSSVTSQYTYHVSPVTAASLLLDIQGAALALADPSLVDWSLSDFLCQNLSPTSAPSQASASPQQTLLTTGVLATIIVGSVVVAGSVTMFCLRRRSQASTGDHFTRTDHKANRNQYFNIGPDSVL